MSQGHGRLVRIAAAAVRVGGSPTLCTPEAVRAALDGGHTPGPAEPPARPDAVPAGAWRRMSHLSRLVAAVALEALDRAGPAAGPHDALFTVWGTAFGEMTTTAGLLARMASEGADKVSPIGFQTSLFGTPLAHLSLVLGLRGPSETVSAGGASAAVAALRGVDVALRGRPALVLAGDELADMVRTAWALQRAYGRAVPPLGEAVAALLLVPDGPDHAHLPSLAVAPGAHVPAGSPVWARRVGLPMEGLLPDLPELDRGIAAERALGSIPAGGLALAAAATVGGGTVVECDGGSTWTLTIGPAATAAERA